MKNTYNPFKLIGSWIGALVLLCYELVTIRIVVNNPFIYNGTLKHFTFIEAIFKFYLKEIILVVALGFVLGGLIHLIIKK